MKKIILILILLTSLMMVSACKDEAIDPVPGFEKRFSFDNYMFTLINVRILAADAEQATVIQEEVENIYSMYHELTTNYDPLASGSEYLENIYSINQQIGTKLEIDKELYDLLLFAEEIKQLTDGYFDISVGKIVDYWKQIITPEIEPNVNDMVFLTDEEEYVRVISVNQQSGEVFVEGYTNPFYSYDFKQDITASAFNLTLSNATAVDMTDFSILLEEENDKFYITINGEDIKLDLGAIAKGYATQKVYEYLDSQNIEYFSISAGTSSIVVGKNEKRENDVFWISLANPIVTSTTDQAYGTIYTKDTSVTTSGNYEQYVIYQGFRYHHIVSPKTKQPAQFYHTVTLIGQDAGLLDALSTALFSMPPSELQAWINLNQQTYKLDIITFNQDRTISKYLISDLNEDF